MDTLYLVFKDRFQIVFGFALLTEKFSLKQTETLTYQLYSVKAASSVRKMLFLTTKNVALLAKFPKKKAPLAGASLSCFSMPVIGRKGDYRHNYLLVKSQTNRRISFGGNRSRGPLATTSNLLRLMMICPV